MCLASPPVASWTHESRGKKGVPEQGTLLSTCALLHGYQGRMFTNVSIREMSMVLG